MLQHFDGKVGRAVRWRPARPIGDGRSRERQQPVPVSGASTAKVRPDTPCRPSRSRAHVQPSRANLSGEEPSASVVHAGLCGRGAQQGPACPAGVADQLLSAFGNGADASRGRAPVDSRAGPSDNGCGCIFEMMPQPMRPPAPPMGWLMWSSGFSWMMAAEPSSSRSAGMPPPVTETRVVKNSAHKEDGRGAGVRRGAGRGQSLGPDGTPRRGRGRDPGGAGGLAQASAPFRLLGAPRTVSRHRIRNGSRGRAGLTFRRSARQNLVSSASATGSGPRHAAFAGWLRSIEAVSGRTSARVVIGRKGFCHG